MPLTVGKLVDVLTKMLDEGLDSTLVVGVWVPDRSGAEVVNLSDTIPDVDMVESFLAFKLDRPD